jgi:DNA-binding MarR family transcriptional regulator
MNMPSSSTPSDLGDTASGHAGAASGGAHSGADPDRAAADLADTTISIAAHLESELSEALAPQRLTRPSYLVLDALERAGGAALPQRELVARVRRTAGTMSVRLGRLERAGVIDREPEPDDRRSVTVTLTDRGRKLVRAARPAYEERAQRLLEGLDAPGQAVVAEQLPSWLSFFEPDERSAPRLGAAVAPGAVAARMRAAVGLPDEAGVLVLHVKAASPADAADLSRGDLITHAGGKTVRSVGDLDRAVRTAPERLELKVLRGAEPRDIQVTLGE